MSKFSVLALRKQKPVSLNLKQGIIVSTTPFLLKDVGEEPSPCFSSFIKPSYIPWLQSQ